MRSVAATLMLAALTLPANALACPVCSPGRDDATQQAFFSMTIFMTLLPLAMFGVLAYFVVRRIRAAEAADDFRPELSPTTEE
jgi:heme/copper-type cytochrome/quinol oxidase subunit 2